MSDARAQQWDPKAWFDRGMNWSDFLATAELNVERMREFYEKFTFSGEVLAFYRARTPLNVLAIGEDWCPDVVQNLALVARLAEEIKGMNLRILKRDTNPDVMTRFLTDGKKRIPVFVFLDGSFNELGDWRGRCASADAWIFGEILAKRAWKDMSKEELGAFNDEYDRRFWASYVGETLAELEAALQD